MAVVWKSVLGSAKLLLAWSLVGSLCRLLVLVRAFVHVDVCAYVQVSVGTCADAHMCKYT